MAGDKHKEQTTTGDIATQATLISKTNQQKFAEKHAQTHFRPARETCVAGRRIDSPSDSSTDDAPSAYPNECTIQYAHAAPFGQLAAIGISGTVIIAVKLAHPSPERDEAAHNAPNHFTLAVTECDAHDRHIRALLAADLLADGVSDLNWST